MSKNNIQLKLRPIQSLLSGIDLPSIEYCLDSTQVFMFSAITWNRHKIHYDQVEAKKEGHQSVLIQRGLIGNLFTRFIGELFLDVFIQRLEWKVFSSAFPGDRLSCSCEIKEPLSDSLEQIVLVLTIINQDQQEISKATAVVREINEVDLIRPLTKSYE